MDKKRRVFNAAARLFARKGFEKTTVDEIAEAADVAKGTVYYHFKGKEDLFLFLVEEGMNILRGRVDEVIKSAGDLRDMLRQVLRVQIRFFEEFRDVCMIVLTEAWGASVRQEKLQQLINGYFVMLGETIGRSPDRDGLRIRDGEVLVSALFGMSVVVALHYFRKDGPVDWAGIEDQLETILLHGI